MKIENDFKNIQDFIAQNKLDKAIQLFIECARAHHLEALKDVIIISRDYQSVNQALLVGLLKREDGAPKIKEIAYRVFQLINRIKDEIGMV